MAKRHSISAGFQEIVPGWMEWAGKTKTPPERGQVVLLVLIIVGRWHHCLYAGKPSFAQQFFVAAAPAVKQWLGHVFNSLMKKNCFIYF